MVATRRRALLLTAIVLIVAACGAPNPSPSVTSSAPVVSTAPATAAPATAAPASATAAPTTGPTATPVAVLPKRGAEVFDAGEGVWKVAASSDNLGEVSQTTVHRRLGDEAEVFVACIGAGTLHVTVDAVKDAYSTGVSLVDETVECPTSDGKRLSIFDETPVGWSPNPDAAPSNDSIRYQVRGGHGRPLRPLLPYP